jgi:hypothetical protein
MTEMPSFTGDDGLFQAERQRSRTISVLFILDIILLVIGVFPGLIEAVVSILPL